MVTCCLNQERLLCETVYFLAYIKQVSLNCAFKLQVADCFNVNYTVYMSSEVFLHMYVLQLMFHCTCTLRCV